MKTLLIGLLVAGMLGTVSDAVQQSNPRLDCYRVYDPGYCDVYYRQYREYPHMMPLDLRFPDPGTVLNQAEDIKRKRMENELLRRRLQNETE